MTETILESLTGGIDFHHLERLTGAINFLHLIPSSVNVDWDAVAKRLKSHPQDALEKFTNYQHTILNIAIRNRATPIPASIVKSLLLVAGLDVEADDLFVACENTSLSGDVVAEILDHCPNLISVTRVQNHELPLHIAVRCGHMEATRVLVCRYPPALATKDRNGDLPLHNAMYYDVSTEMIKLLISEGCKIKIGGDEQGAGGLFVKNNDGNLPLDLALDRVNSLLQDVNEGEAEEADINDRWQSLMVCLQAAGAAKTRQPDCFSYPFLHAVMMFAASSPYEKIISKALDECSDDSLVEKDPLGRTPLDLAIEKRLANGEFEDTKFSEHLFTVLLGSSDKQRQTTASTKDKDGRYILHRAAEAGVRLEEGLERIVAAYPVAVEQQDTKSRLYPFMLAATSNKNESINEVYYLLRMHPSFVEGGIKPSDDAIHLMRKHKEQMADVEKNHEAMIRKLKQECEDLKQERQDWEQERDRLTQDFKQEREDWKRERDCLLQNIAHLKGESSHTVESAKKKTKF